METRTINDVNAGDKFTLRGRVHEYVVTAIKRNKDGGKPCYDEWGAEVWETPMFSIEAVEVHSGKKSLFAVQSEKSDLSSWLIFRS